MSDPWESIIDYIDEGLAKALSHPLRVQILAELNKQVMSPSGFSERFEVPLTKVSYHFDVLEKAGFLELVHEEPRGNLVEHYYRATKKVLFDSKAWESLPETIRSSLSGRTVGDFLGTIAEAMLAGTFDSRTNRHTAWGREHVDEEGWREVSAIQEETAERLIEVIEKSHSRLIRSGEPGLMATWGLFLFESPFEEPESPSDSPPG